MERRRGHHRTTIPPDVQSCAQHTTPTRHTKARVLEIEVLSPATRADSGSFRQGAVLVLKLTYGLVPTMPGVHIKDHQPGFLPRADAHIGAGEIKLPPC